MADLTGFNPQDFPDEGPRAYLIPAGTYKAMILDSRQRTSVAGNDYLELEVEITDGEFAGRKLWDKLNLWHPKEQAADIAKRKLASACRALGIAAPRDSTDLHERPLAVIVKTRRRTDNGETVSEVSGYAAISPPAVKRITADDVRAGVANALAGQKPPAEKRPLTPDDDGIPF
jgi:hypothetical protein